MAEWREASDWTKAVAAIVVVAVFCGLVAYAIGVVLPVEMARSLWR